jgi:hypothetical protein
MHFEVGRFAEHILESWDGLSCGIVCLLGRPKQHFQGSGYCSALRDGWVLFRHWTIARKELLSGCLHNYVKVGVIAIECSIRVPVTSRLRCDRPRLAGRCGLKDEVKLDVSSSAGRL